MALNVYTTQELAEPEKYHELVQEDEEQQGPLSSGFVNLFFHSNMINQLARKGFTPVLEVAAVYQACPNESFLLRDSRDGLPCECNLNMHQHLQDMAWGLAVGTRVILLSYCSDHCFKRNKQILKVHDFKLFNESTLPPNADFKKIEMLLRNDDEQQQQKEWDGNGNQPKDKAVPTQPIKPKPVMRIRRKPRITRDHFPPVDNRDAEDNKYGVRLVALNPLKFGLKIWRRGKKLKCDDHFALITGPQGQILKNRVLCLREDCMAVVARSDACRQRHLDDHEYFDNPQKATEEQQKSNAKDGSGGSDGEEQSSADEVSQTGDLVVKKEPVDDEDPIATTSQPTNPQNNHNNSWDYPDRAELSTGFLDLFFDLNPTDPIPEVTPVLAIAVVYLGQYGEPFWVRDHPNGERRECYLKQELKPMVIGQPEGTRVIIGHSSMVWKNNGSGKRQRKIMIIKDMQLFTGDHLPKSAIKLPEQPETVVEEAHIEREPILINMQLPFDSRRFEKMPWIGCSHEILPKYFCFMRVKRGSRKGEFVKYLLCMPCNKVIPRQKPCSHLRDKHGVTMLYKRYRGDDDFNWSDFVEIVPSTSLQNPEVTGQNIPHNPEHPSGSSSDLILKSGEIVPIFGPEEQRLKALREMVAVVKQQIAEKKAPKPPKQENELKRRSRLKREADAARVDSVWHYFEKPAPLQNQHQKRHQSLDIIRCKHCDYTERQRYTGKNAHNGNVCVRGLLLHLERAHPELFRVRKQMMDAQRKKEMRNKREITVEAIEDGTFELRDWLDDSGRLRKYGELYKDVLKKGVQTRQIICTLCLEQQEECVVFSKYNNRYYSTHYRWHIGRGELVMGGDGEDGEQEEMEEEENSAREEEGSKEEGEDEEEEMDDEEEEGEKEENSEEGEHEGSDGMEYNDDQNDEDFIP